MELNLMKYCNTKIQCSCGREHFCPIAEVDISEGALLRLPEAVSSYRHILLVADTNTDAACGSRVRELLGARVQRYLIYQRDGHLVPNEAAVAELEAAVTEETDFILGVGSGVINDLCKYVSWQKGLECGIVATAPSMDGYASSGAAMIMNGMKITYTVRPPKLILGDVDVLRQAPLDMIRSGYGDIIGKYSSLNDWRLSHLLNGEHLCPEIYDLVMSATDRVRDSAEAIVRREGAAIADLTKTLALIGITLSLHGSTRPGSGSEHHLSHFFEIVGLIRNQPHYPHGTDVAYATVVTAGMRERILRADPPEFRRESPEAREVAWRRVYGPLTDEIRQLQRQAGWYEKDLQSLYRAHWDEVRQVLGECPSAEECREMLARAGFAADGLETMYGEEKIREAMFYGKDLKDRFSMLWLYYDLFSGAQA